VTIAVMMNVALKTTRFLYAIYEFKRLLSGKKSLLANALLRVRETIKTSLESNHSKLKFFLKKFQAFLYMYLFK